MNANFYPGKHGERGAAQYGPCTAGGRRRRTPKPAPAPTWYREVSAWTSRLYFGHQITAAQMVEMNEIASALDRAGEGRVAA